MADDSARQVRVAGRVQGVWFRAWTQREALRLGLRGWVRNEADGSVSALIAGPGDAMQAMLAALHEGPETAHVDQVMSDPFDGPVPEGFEIRR